MPLLSLLFPYIPHLKLQNSLRKQGLKLFMLNRSFLSLSNSVAKQSTKTRIETLPLNRQWNSPLQLQNSLRKQGLKQKKYVEFIWLLKLQNSLRKTRIETCTTGCSLVPRSRAAVAKQSTKTRIETREWAHRAVRLSFQSSCKIVYENKD